MIREGVFGGNIVIGLRTYEYFLPILMRRIGIFSSKI
jgi:hypothetical protein